MKSSGWRPPPGPPPPPFESGAKPRRWPLLLSAVAIGAAAAVGIWAWDLYQANSANSARLAELDERNRSLSDALELHRASKVDLDTKLTTCKDELEEQTVASNENGARLASCESSVSDLREHKAQTERMLAEFNALTNRFQQMIDSGKLDVVFRRGRMVVKLPAQVLFPSGSATLSEAGTQALAEVAKVLSEMKDKRFLVAGHTDNVPISGEFADNWELSTARALRVTTMLIEQGVPPRNLGAAGYGQYAPVANNKTVAGRRRNRRIEIILEPDLRQLPLGKLVDSEPQKRAGKKKPAGK